MHKTFARILPAMLLCILLHTSALAATDGEDRYLSMFSAVELPDSVVARMRTASMKEDCPVKPSQLRYLTLPHHDGKGGVSIGEMVVAAEIADEVVEIFRNLFLQQYPIESMRLIDDFGGDDVKSMQHNNTSAFNYRKVAGSTKLSKHALGLAIDLNPLYNPYVKGKVVSPEEGRRYINRSDSSIPYKIDTQDAAYKEFIRHGFKWGGSWKSLKDYQHFEK